MALKFSTGLKKFLMGYGSMAQAFSGGVIKIYSGTAPASADDAATGTELVTVSLASGTVTPEVAATGIINLTGGAGGSVDTITIAGIEVMGAAVSYATSLTVTAANVVAQINKYQHRCPIRLIATSSGPDITLTVGPGVGAKLNGQTLACTVTTITKTINGGSSSTIGGTGAVAGVNSVNGLTFDEVLADTLSKLGVFSGTNSTSGTAGYFRMHSAVADAGGASSTLRRLQGTCGTTGSGADYGMTTTALTGAATHTLDTWTLTRL